MNKILNYILIFFLFTLSSCDYKPILSYKNYKFSINVEKITGDEKVNSIITSNLNNLKGNEKEFYVTLSSKKEKNIISKDSKGDPAIFKRHDENKKSVRNGDSNARDIDSKDLTEAKEQNQDNDEAQKELRVSDIYEVRSLMRLLYFCASISKKKKGK